MSDLTFDILNERNTHLLWPKVRRYLLKVVERNDAFNLPEDVYAQMIAGGALVAVFAWKGEERGAIVLKRTVRDDGLPEVYAWAMAADTDEAIPMDFFRAMTQHLRDHARATGAASVMMVSKRPGWSRVLNACGWTPTYVTYEIAAAEDNGE